MIIKIIQPFTNEYNRMIEFRVKSLLEPIGVPATYIQPEKEKDDIFITALSDNEIIGCCILTKVDDTTVQLRQMAVLEEYRGRKIGNAIIEFSEKTAKEKGYSTLMIHARDQVMEFYNKSGYEIAGEQFFEVGMGHHRMEKKLDRE
ncbi:MAG: GNAT family N-acetyltransferase [Flavisolibacter sp.]